MEYTCKVWLVSLLVNLSFMLYPREFVNNPGLAQGGFFANVGGIIGLLDAYEHGFIQGFRVDFGVNGLYYEPSHGANWWNYYFMPLIVGKHNGATRILSDAEIGWYSYNATCKIVRHRGYQLIKKYIKIQPSIVKKMAEFVNRNFKNSFVIGIHYRGTDKIHEARRVAYDEVAQALTRTIKYLKLKQYKIFVATDEQPFLEYIKHSFSQVVYINARRAQDEKPIHYSAGYSKYKLGEECLLDMLLLAECSLLIRTASNVSAHAALFNPRLHVINLTKQGENCLR